MRVSDTLQSLIRIMQFCESNRNGIQDAKYTGNVLKNLTNWKKWCVFILPVIVKSQIGKF